MTFIRDIFRFLFPHGIVLFVLAALTLLLVEGCREVPVDRLYALRLNHAPSEADWTSAMPRVVTVRGGSVNKPRKLADIDEDTVHTSTASCHHGAALPEPLTVDMRAFYTDSDIYLRLEWFDPTCDDGMRQWRFDERWTAAGSREDGLGLMWDAKSSFPGFTCSYACHIDDFGVSGASFHARNRMRLARTDALVDLWNWKADRTDRYNFADDRYLDEKGMHADVPGEIFHPNSISGSAGGDPFGTDDEPLYDHDGNLVSASLQLSGAVAPGYLVDRPSVGRADIKAFSRYSDGRWTVILSRALDTGDKRDVVFLPGDEEGVSFGLSIMDNTLDQHYASSTEEKLVLMADAWTLAGSVK